MNRNLFFKELKRNALSLIIWMSVITLLICLTMSIYRTFIANQSKVMGMLSLIPKGMLQFKGISDVSELLSPLGFYAVNNVIYMLVLGSIFSIVLSSNILLKEEYSKTAEYLISRPLTRSEIFLSKLAVVFVNVFLMNVVASGAGFTCIEIVKNAPFSIKAFLILSLYTFLLNIMFGAAGLFLSAMIKRPKPITTFCIGLVLIMYFIYTLSKITEGASKIGYLSPFRYVDLEVTSPGYRLESGDLAFFLGISVILLAVSFRLYSRRDIFI
ncbi:MAG: ABC transporter permease subunit [Bacteroidales bacterium]